ncbi:unnamed protein product [Peniophora sp. CBMAI 1063]|nr:unnamed protein product [Peniophora sp. CBMAI 1063]
MPPYRSVKGRRYFCRCPTCRKNKAFDGVTGKTIWGVYLNHDKFYRHQVEWRETERAEVEDAIALQTLREVPDRDGFVHGSAGTQQLRGASGEGSITRDGILEESCSRPVCISTVDSSISGVQIADCKIDSQESRDANDPAQLRTTNGDIEMIGTMPSTGAVADENVQEPPVLLDETVLIADQFMKECQFTLDEMTRNWKEPVLSFHGGFTDGHAGGPYGHLRHNDSPDNYRFLHSKETAVRLLKHIADYPVPSHAQEIVILKEELTRKADMWNHKHDQVAQEQWFHLRTELRFYNEVNLRKIDTSGYFYDFTGFSAPHLVGMLTAIVLYLIFGVSRNASHFLLSAIQILMVELVTAFCHSHGLVFPNASLEVTHGWLVDMRSVIQRFNLSPQYVEYARCPNKKCGAIHTIDPTNPDFADVCGHRGCQARLFRQSVRVVNKAMIPSSSTPHSTFCFQSPSAWFGRLLSRHNIEHGLLSHPVAPDKSGLEHDFWFGRAVREVLDEHNNPFFGSPVRDGEIRLAVGLFVDWFNPFGKRTSKTQSVGAIYMVCMNIPPDIRYRVENMCLIGVIPGPKEPALQNLNHYLSPIVDDLLSLWTPGIVLSRTAKSFDILVRAVLLPLIADTPAIRKAQGVLGFSSTKAPCSLCAITSGELSNFDYQSWPRRSWAYHLQHGQAWRDAPNDVIREKMALKTGIRWSELLRLPYWNPARFSVVDAMHNLFLGDIAAHLVSAWGMRWKDPRGSNLANDEELASAALADPSDAGPTRQTRKPQTPEDQRRVLNIVLEAWKKQDEHKLSSVRLDYLRAVATLNGVPGTASMGTKIDIANAMIAWIAKFGANAIRMPSPIPETVLWFECDETPADIGARILDNEELESIWPFTTRIFLPSWMDRGPRHFGKPGQGTLKADNWRTIGTVLLPLSLILLWGKGGSRHDDFHEKLLKNFLHLVAAVNIASLHATSQERRLNYLRHLQTYAVTLKLLLPNYPIRPNLHMSFHIAEVLELFGPVAAWWTFPFERYNGVMRNIQTNGRFGQLEKTFFEVFCRACNLRALMEQVTEAGLIPSFTALLSKILGGNVPGADSSPHKSRASKLTPEQMVKLAARLNSEADEVQYSLEPVKGCVQLSPEVTTIPFFERRGVKYASSATSRRDCDVLAYFPHESKGMTAGRITEIFTYVYQNAVGSTASETFVVFRCFKPLSEAEAGQDPFRGYDGIDACSYHNELLPEVHILKAVEVTAHFAALIYRTRLALGEFEVDLEAGETESWFLPVDGERGGIGFKDPAGTEAHDNDAFMYPLILRLFPHSFDVGAALACRWRCAGLGWSAVGAALIDRWSTAGAALIRRWGCADPSLELRCRLPLPLCAVAAKALEESSRTLF